MKDLAIAAAQFEARDADKDYNLSRIDGLTAQAVGRGAEVVSFHECCIPGYTFLMTLSKPRIQQLAEPVPGGPSTDRLIQISKAHGVPVLAGLVEADGDALYNTYVAVTPDGFLAKHRKLHAFISKFISSGDSFTVFELCFIFAFFLLVLLGVLSHINFSTNAFLISILFHHLFRQISVLQHVDVALPIVLALVPRMFLPRPSPPPLTVCLFWILTLTMPSLKTHASLPTSSSTFAFSFCSSSPLWHRCRSRFLLAPARASTHLRSQVVSTLSIG